MKETDLKKEARVHLLSIGIKSDHDIETIIGLLDKATLSERKRCAEIARNVWNNNYSNLTGIQDGLREVVEETGTNIATAIEKDV
ncbi:MAG: hypothetical protein QQN63_08915 [Nitrosopumilus sp.]